MESAQPPTPPADSSTPSKGMKVLIAVDDSPKATMAVEIPPNKTTGDNCEEESPQPQTPSSESSATSTEPSTPTSDPPTPSIGMRVLIAVDDSPQSSMAVEWYGKWIHRPGNEVILGHCSSMKMPDYNASPHLMKEMMFKAEAQDSEIGRAANEILAKYGASGKFVILLGKPAESIVDAVKEKHIHMVVIGKRNISKLKKKLSGSVSSHVISHAHVPVLVCPEPRSSKESKH